ncbi:SulP family inorganic anion transporter [Terasakiella pusilla]|uniref:SulP family inorganic anion transporter n=1 Tax=Terasakiella pusilla TaxID=64973 RepID=UPI003AA9833F
MSSQSSHPVLEGPLLSKNSWHLFVPKTYVLLRQGYTAAHLKQDVFAGLTVAIVALPLSMALAIASGTTPDKGLITAIVAGLLISLLGGSRYQIGGPTGAFVVVVFNVIAQFGYNGLVLATLMAGGMLVLAGLCRLGTYIKYIPDPVVTGFTSGIALLIFTGQINDFLGLHLDNLPADFLGKITALAQNLHKIESHVITISLLSLLLILFLRRLAPKWPGFLIAIVAMSLLVWSFDLSVETIGSKFGEMPSSLPAPMLPDLSFDLVKQLFPSALTIAFLAGIESLLSAVVADGMTGTRHRSNCELVAQGVANFASALFGGMPATGAIARTATNIRAGAYSPLSGIIHAVALLLVVLLFAPLAAYIPLACLSAILMIVAWNMSEADKVIHHFKAPIGDQVVLWTTLLLTVFVDLNLAIQVGFVFSAVLFMHKMAEAVKVQTHHDLLAEDIDDLVDPTTTHPRQTLPEGVLSYHFNGPFFFGAAQGLLDRLTRTGTPPNVVILNMRDVPFIDSSGSNALSIFIRQASKSGVWLLITGCTPAVKKTLEKMNALSQMPHVQFYDHYREAVHAALLLNSQRLN